jgi:hypothetical protein
MQAIQGVYDGKNIRPLEPIRAHPNVRVIITFIDAEPIEGLPTTRLQEVAGCLHYTGPAKTLADMENAIRKGIEENWK